MTTIQAVDAPAFTPIPSSWTEDHAVAYFAVYVVRTIRRIRRNTAR